MRLAVHLLLPVFVDEGVEGHSVFPAGGEVGDVDIGISAKQQPGDVMFNQCLLLLNMCCHLPQ